ncbi:hypothetical protein GOY12_02970 [Wolbachia endosymbiont of Dirofilaria (Dirofilaria) immitis]|nr:hypothetical protein GOY12_02970 [Wolbachia endosymbiont of Dirofilaria (Dirofilaria) immitis]
MSFGQIIICSTILLAIAAIFFFFRKIYRGWVRKIIFPKEGLKEECEENRKYNELYQENKRRELIKRLEMLRERQKDIQYKGDPKIVGIAKPVGKWTKMVIVGSNLMQRFAQLIYKKDRQKGFWEIFIRAQASTREKHKGRGR